MLGVSFPEIAVFLAVALLVLGPEKTLKASRSMGRAFSRIRGYLRECERELDLEDVRKAASSVRGNMLDFRAAAARGLEEAGDEVKPAAGAAAASVNDTPQSASTAPSRKSSWPRPPAYVADEQLKELQGRVSALEQEMERLKAQCGK